MKKLNSILKILFTGALLLCAVSCKYELVPEPTGNGGTGGSDLSDTIDPPTGLMVSHGNYRSIELNWIPAKNAVQYQIYSAATPYDPFVQEGETAGKETTFTIDETSGITKYYMVKAVNYYGKASRGSKIVMGTTLDVPIITEITASEEGTCVDVNWWMGNCSENTYASSIEYTVYAYTLTKAKVPGIEIVVPGTENHCVVNGLTPRTDYWFTVEAKKINSEQKSEISDLTNAQTAHKVIPAAAENLKVTKGTNKNQVEISWTLPDSVDYYDKASKLYSSHPVYFTIQRKPLGAEDKAYTTIAPYIGCGTASGLKFNCSTSSSSDASKLKVSGYPEGEKNDLYPAYISGSTITYIDKTAVTGNQYTYKVQSYTDYASSEITSENSIATADGWKLSAPAFKAESTMTKEGNLISSIDINFNLSFVDFADYYKENELPYPYTYVITYKQTNFASETYSEQVLFSAYSLEEVKAKTDTINNPSDESIQGYYTYKLYIINASESEIKEVPASYLETVTSANIITVTDDATLIPEIKNFKISDGYKNKFVLSWDKVEDATYTLSWANYVDGELTTEDSKVLAASDYSVSGNTVTFTHTAESGDARQYTLNISKNGIPDTKEYETISKTLGTAIPEMKAPDYKTITVTWPAVQMANPSYTITAAYADKTTVLADNYEITTDEETGIVTCVITEPKGYNNINKSGLPVNFTVTAKSSTTEDTTSTTITTRTLGPALIGTSVSSEIQAKTLSVSWNTVEGATGYIIYRTKHSYNTTKKAFAFDRADYYYCSTEGKLKESGNDVPSIRAKVAVKNGVFTLTDYDADVTDDTSSYERNQSQISWGIPFGYVVLPVNGDVSDFTFGSDSNYLKVTGGKANVIYSSALNEKKTSTFGYGLNVTAAKSESASAVKVTWTKPYVEDLIPTLYKMPFSKEEGHDYTSNWTLVKELAAGATSYEDVLAVDDIASAFVYAVQYQAPRTSNFTESYRDNLAKDKESTETKNKGYLLTLKNFEAVYGGTDTSAGDASYYQENVTWDKVWDYEERAIGPDSFTIDIKNRNLASTMNWTTIASVSINNNVQTITAETGFADTTVTKMASGDGITIKPTGLSAGTKTDTSDLLMVLRDAKHYYSVNLTRGTNDPVRQAGDNSKYAYRQITKEELGKCVALNIADAVYKTGIPDRKIYTVDGSTGTFRLACSDGITDANRIQWELTKYTTLFAKGCSADTKSLESFITLNSQSSSFSSKGISYNTLYYLPALDITVTSTVPLSSYSGTINFTVGAAGTSKKFNITMSKDGSQICSVSNDSTEYYKWMPYDLGSKHASADSTVNTALKTYQSPWWN